MYDDFFAFAQMLQNPPVLQQVATNWTYPLESQQLILC